MPDTDGLSAGFSDGRTYCHGCSTWITGPAEIRDRRARCGPRWRRTIRRARREELDEQLVLLKDTR